MKLITEYRRLFRNQENLGMWQVYGTHVDSSGVRLV